MGRGPTGRSADMRAKAVTGNQLPNQTRWLSVGEGRSGKSQGELWATTPSARAAANHAHCGRSHAFQQGQTQRHRKTPSRRHRRAKDPSGHLGVVRQLIDGDALCAHVRDRPSGRRVPAEALVMRR